MKLLAIPNDATSAYFRNYEEDFLSEFNPKINNKERVFDQVKFLNWKDDKTIEHYGISSIPFLKDKTKATEIMKSLSSGEINFSAPLFYDLFEKEIKQIDKEILKFNPDIIRAFNTHFAAELGNIISKRYNLPLVVSAHDPSRLTNAINTCDSLICISNDLKNKCLSYGVEESKIKIIPDGIDMDHFYKREQNQINLNGNYKILSVGRIVPSKNIETLLKSISLLKNEFKGIKHLHLGNGSIESLNEINLIKNNLGLENISYFIGGIKKEELPFYYSWADLYALPTLWEGLGRAQIESLACETPVITSNEPPMNEIVIDGYNGYTANPKNPKDFAEKIKKYFNNKDIKNHMGENSRKSVYEKYNMNNVMFLHAENYLSLLK